jgi:iron complex outermembrane receptor protein
MTLGVTARNPPGNVNYDQHFTLFTQEPYLEFDWKVTPDLTLTPGIKYAFFKVGENAVKNQGSKLPIDTSQSFTKALPAIAANYRLSESWATYAQVAEGYDPPPINILYTKNPSLNNVDAQTTWNYQVGVTHQADALTLSADAYYIRFRNAVASTTVGGITTYFNQGGVTYKGVEAEGTLRLGAGFSFYANGSINRAKNILTDQYVAEAPIGTAGAGILFDNGALSGSLIDKWTGSRYGDVGQLQPIDSFNQLDFAAGYKFKGTQGGIPRMTLKLEVLNLLDSTKINDFAGYSGGSKTPLFFTQVGRGYFVSLEMPLLL